MINIDNMQSFILFNLQLWPHRGVLRTQNSRSPLRGVVLINDEWCCPFGCYRLFVTVFMYFYVRVGRCNFP